MAEFLKVDPASVKQANTNFGKLQQKVAVSASKKILKKAGHPINQEAADNAPRHFGLLRKSFLNSEKVKYYRKSGSVIFIGGADYDSVVARSNYVRPKPKTIARGRWLRIRPAKYLNIVRTGRHTGKHGTFKGSDFQEKAFDEKKLSALDIIKWELGKAVDEAARSTYTRAAKKL